jgi:CubicO group peptidase (beta-lactamase class C family)
MRDASRVNQNLSDPSVNVMEKTIQAIEDGITRGDHLGAQLNAMIDGNVVADLAIGQSRPGIALRTDDLLPWMSAGKPITAVAILQLIERGQLAVDDRIEQFIPEFGQGGKSAITVRHVLTHTGGFRLVSNNWSTELWERIIERIGLSKIETGWTPGEKAGYHVASGWFILGELIRRIDGRTFDRYARREILEPLAMRDSWIGMPSTQFNAYGGFDGRIAPIYSTEKEPPRIKGMVNTEAGCTECRPGANARGPIRELALFYQMLLNGGELDGRRILGEAMVRQMVTRERRGMFDETFKHVIDWGLGVIINSSHYRDDGLPYGFGPYASDDSFGHGGNQSSCGIVDPERRLVLTWVCNGMPGEARHDARVRAINTAVYEDLGFP